MLFKLGIALLFFLPVIESINRQWGFGLLLMGSLFVSFKYLSERKIILDKINALWVIMLIAFIFLLMFPVGRAAMVSLALALFVFILYFDKSRLWDRGGLGLGIVPIL